MTRAEKVLEALQRRQKPRQVLAESLSITKDDEISFLYAVLNYVEGDKRFTSADKGLLKKIKALKSKMLKVGPKDMDIQITEAVCCKNCGCTAVPMGKVCASCGTQVIQ